MRRVGDGKRGFTIHLFLSITDRLRLSFSINSLCLHSSQNRGSQKPLCLTGRCVMRNGSILRAARTLMLLNRARRSASRQVLDAVEFPAADFQNNMFGSEFNCVNLSRMLSYAFGGFSKRCPQSIRNYRV